MGGKNMGTTCMQTIQRRWDAACKVLFKRELGDIGEYAKWLTHNNEPIIHRKSSVTGKDVAYAISAYGEGSKWIGFDEIDFGKSYPPLNLNEIKDIDSIAQAVRERIYYAGSVILGNSGEVEKSSNISDSFFMHETGKFGDCKYLAFSTLGRLCDSCFGCNGIGESQFCIKSYETFKEKRCFEFWMGQNSSDCYYSHNLSSCSDCMFCFSLKNRRNSIGNLELEPEKYRRIKDSLVFQLASELEQKKEAPSLIDIVGGVPLAKPLLPNMPKETKKEGNMMPIEGEFAKTCEILFGKRLPGRIDDYSEWLSRRVRKSEQHLSAASGKTVRRWDYCNYFLLPKNRLLTQAEALAFGESARISDKEAEGLTMEAVGRAIGKLAFFSTEYEEGTNTNIIECPTPTQSANSYRSSPVVYSKHCAYSFWPRSCEHVYGCNAMFDSEFCIHCYHSVKLKRCFEMDTCRDCTDSMFCHNCENVHESMFCFNVKNLRYAIGNAELGREKYLEARGLVQKEIVKKLGQRRNLEKDIYNVGMQK